MKTLYVLRHAKSSWKDRSLSDFDRPLNKRGKKAAPFMGELMKKMDLIPEIIISSPAMRAKTTAKLVKESAGFDEEIHFNESIYGASSTALLYIVGSFVDSYNSAMIVGHNPGFEGIVQVLSGEYYRITTANLAVIDLNIENWKEAEPNCGSLREILRPKEQMI